MDNVMHDWAIRVFGSIEAYRRSLPEREWVQGTNGWYSAPRNAA